MTDDIQADELHVLKDISRKLDILTLAVMDLRMHTESTPTPASPAKPANIRHMNDAGRDIYRIELPGKHWLKVIANTDERSPEFGTAVVSVVLPDGREVAASIEEVEQQFGPVPGIDPAMFAPLRRYPAPIHDAANPED